MNKVITINLNGNAYQVDEDGYDKLRLYLNRAEAQLKDNPDKFEIVADLEQAIAEKCASYLRPHKTVITGIEVERIIKDMGPVDEGRDENNTAKQPDAEPATASAEKSAADSSAPKRLYQIRDGAMISGVCKGLAAYFNIDVAIVRIAFVTLTILAHGLWILVYLAMMFVIPFANTTEERAAAHGMPFNAQEVIEQAKKHYSEFKNSHEWRQHWREQRGEWKRRWQQEAHWWGHNMQRNLGQSLFGASYAAQVFSGVLMPVLGIISVLIFWAWLFAAISLLTTGAVFGWPLPAGMSLWAGTLILVVLSIICTAPINALRRAAYHAAGARVYAWFAIWDAILWLGVSALIIWFAYHHYPQVRTFIEHFQEIITGVWNSLRNDLSQLQTKQPTT